MKRKFNILNRKPSKYRNEKAETGNSKKCLHCGVMFLLSRHKHIKYCSHSCANKASAEVRKRRVTKICQTCDKPFEITMGELRYRRTVKFCSPKCVGLWKRVHTPTTEVKCAECGGRILLHTARAVRRKNHFCNDDCRLEHYTKNHPSKADKRAWSKLISERMSTPEVKEKMSMLNSRKRAPMKTSHKVKISDKLVGKFPANHTRQFSNIQSGTYICSKGDFFFRSKWEANYALYLDFLVKNGDITNWEYEADRFMFEKIKLGTRSYTPDFKIFNKNASIEYHEVKGYMDSRSKTKLKRMAKYFPETKLVLIEQKQYNEIMKKLKGVIKFY